MHTLITADLFTEKPSRGYALFPTFAGTVEGFTVEISAEYDSTGADYWYGRFCEESNAPAHAHLVRNPNAWVKQDTGNGTDSWVRTTTRNYGWFAWELYNPKDEVEGRKSHAMSEAEAWRQVNAEIRDTVQGLVDGDIQNVKVVATVSRNGIELASDSLGTEIDTRNPTHLTHERILDTGLDCVAEALHNARTALASLCACH